MTDSSPHDPCQDGSCLSSHSFWNQWEEWLKTDKFTGLNCRRDMAPEIISLLELRGKIYVGPCGFLTMPRFLIKSSQTTSQRANPGCAIPPTPQELIRLYKPPAKLVDHISKLQWRPEKCLRLRQIAGIYNYRKRISPYTAMFGTGGSHKESKWDWKRKIITYLSQLAGPHLL